MLLNSGALGTNNPRALAVLTEQRESTQMAIELSSVSPAQQPFSFQDLDQDEEVDTGSDSSPGEYSFVIASSVGYEWWSMRELWLAWLGF